MNIATLISDVRRHGVDMVLAGDTIRLRGPRPLPDQLMMALRARRDEVLEALQPKDGGIAGLLTSWLDDVPERAAILFADAGVPDCYADDLALLVCMPCPPGVPSQRWHRARDALGALIDDCRATVWALKKTDSSTMV